MWVGRPQWVCLSKRARESPPRGLTEKKTKTPIITNKLQQLRPDLETNIIDNFLEYCKSKQKFFKEIVPNCNPDCSYKYENEVSVI